MNPSEKGYNIWGVTTRDQFRAVDELIERSTPSTHFYTLLILSALIITAGILIGNTPVIIGGMLVTPLLAPFLVVALGIITGEAEVTKRAFILIGRSIAYILVGAFVLSIFFGKPDSIPEISNSLRTGILYLVIAIASGIAATYAWTKIEASEALPGVAVAVSLVPPIAFTGVALGTGHFDLARFYFFIFIVNLIGIIAGSMLVFSQLGFYRTKKEVMKKAEEVINNAKKLQEVKSSTQETVVGIPPQE